MSPADRIRRIVGSRWFAAKPDRAARELLEVADQVEEHKSTEQSLDDQIRAFVVNRFLTGSRLGHRLIKAAADIEALEGGNPQIEPDGSTWRESTVTAPENADPGETDV